MHSRSTDAVDKLDEKFIDLGMVGTSAIFLIAIFALVTYLTITRADAPLASSTK